MWTDKEIEELKKLINEGMKICDIAKQLGKSYESVNCKMRRMGIKSQVNRVWTEEDIDFLSENWGLKSLKTIATKLNRTQIAVKYQAQKLGLGNARDNSLNVKLVDFIANTGLSKDRIVKLASKNEFPLIKQRLEKRTFYFVNLERVLEWMEENQDLYDGSKISHDLFVNEPDWLKNKRIKDSKSKKELKSSAVTRKWSKDELMQLKDMITIGYTYQEIADRLNRTFHQVQRRAQQENFSYNAPQFWKGSEFKYIREHWEHQSDTEMAKALGRSRKSVVKQRLALGFIRRQVKDYTPEDIEYIKNNLDKTDDELGKRLGRSKASIIHIRNKLNIIKQGKRHEWLEDDKDYILNNLDKTDNELADCLGITYDSVSSFRARNGIRKRLDDIGDDA